MYQTYIPAFYINFYGNRQQADSRIYYSTTDDSRIGLGVLRLIQNCVRTLFQQLFEESMTNGQTKTLMQR